MEYERIDYDPHARQRMRKRLISERQVTSTITNPDRRYPSGDRMVAERLTQEGNTIRVVYVEETSPTGTIAYVLTVIRMARSRQ